MNQIIIELKEIVPELTPGEIILLKAIYTENKVIFNKFLKVYDQYVPSALESLQKKQYIKIMGEEFDDIACRDKTNILFGKFELEFDIDIVLNHLNNKLNKPRGFSLKSKGNRRFVSARLKEDYSKEDLIKVIDTMCSKWQGTNAEQYLRPETLFNDTKFQGYLMLADKNDSDDTDWTIDRA